MVYWGYSDRSFQARILRFAISIRAAFRTINIFASLAHSSSWALVAREYRGLSWYSMYPPAFAPMGANVPKFDLCVDDFFIFLSPKLWILPTPPHAELWLVAA
jgi:hypothetical protein